MNTKAGKVLFSHHNELGGFACDPRSGARTASWGSQGGAGAPKVLKHDVDIGLDETLGFRYNFRRKRAEVFFQCGNLKHKFVQGRNGPLSEEDSHCKLFVAPKKGRGNAAPKTDTQSLAQIRAAAASIVS